MGLDTGVRQKLQVTKTARLLNEKRHGFADLRRKPYRRPSPVSRVGSEGLFETRQRAKPYVSAPTGPLKEIPKTRRTYGEGGRLYTVVLLKSMRK